MYISPCVASRAGDSAGGRRHKLVSGDKGKLTWYWGGRSLFALLLSLVIIPHVNPADLCCHRTIISVSTGYLVLWRAVVLCLLGDGCVLSVSVGAGGEAAGAHLTIAQAARQRARRSLAKLF